MTLWPRIASSPASPCGRGRPSSSSTRISTPSTGRPIDPGFRSASRRLNEASGDVSESPYPSRTWQPNCCSNARITSTGIAAPPDTQTSSAEASASAACGYRPHRRRDLADAAPHTLSHV
jgi:hypothetical protein